MGKIHEALAKTQRSSAALKDSEESVDVSDVASTAESPVSEARQREVKKKRRHAAPHKIRTESTGRHTERAEDRRITTTEKKPSPSYVVSPKLITAHHPRSYEAEQFRILRTNLLFPSSGKRPRSILITSAVPEEGKSFISANLAVTIAYNLDNHVLLVDGDVRNPSIHSFFGVPNMFGLGNYLAGDSQLASLLCKTNIPRLSILTAGPPPMNPAELVASDKMKGLLDEVTARYDDRITVIDSPPPQLTAETATLARRVDAILLVVKLGDTSKDIILEVIENLGKDKIVGIVGNFFSINPLSRYAGSRYSRYGHYYGTVK